MKKIQEKGRAKNIIWPIFVPWLSFNVVPSGSTQSYSPYMGFVHDASLS